MTIAPPSIAVLGGLTIDEIYHMNRCRVARGGSAWYLSMTSALLGSEVDVISRIGTDYRQAELDTMMESGIDARRVRRVRGDTCRFALSYARGTRTMRLKRQGPHLSPVD